MYIPLFLTSTLFTTFAHAGISSDLHQSANDIPCDNVEYPIAISSHPYIEEAGSSIKLNKDVKTSLTASNTKSTNNSVSDTYSNKVNINFSFEPKMTAPAGGTEVGFKGSIGYEWSHVKQVTNNTSIAFSQSQQISLTPKISDMTATPVFFKMQVWGAYYKCDSKTKEKIKISSDKAVKLDVAISQGWLLTCPKNKNSECSAKTDYVSN